MRLFIWYWKSGGFNWCYANGRGEALRKAKAMARRTTLKVDEKSLHEGTHSELKKLYCLYD